MSYFLTHAPDLILKPATLSAEKHQMELPEVRERTNQESAIPSLVQVATLVPQRVHTPAPLRL